MLGISPAILRFPSQHTTPAHELITRGVFGLGQHPPHQTETLHTPAFFFLLTKTLRTSEILVIL